MKLNKSSTITLLVASVLFLSACSDGNSNNNRDTRTEFLTLTSYNMGLFLNSVLYTAERLVVNQELLAGYDSDVMCLQEVWLDEHVKAIEQSLQDSHPYTYTVPPEQVYSEGAACSNDDIADLEVCGSTQCDGLSGSALVACASTTCSGPLFALPPACFDGVVATAGIPGITLDIMVDTVTRPAGLFAFDGSLGLVLASKYELKNREFQDFIDDSSSNHRGALYADIEINGQEHLVGCTHAAANLDGTIPYPGSGKHGSWEGENRFMQEQMIAFANEKAGDRPIFFAGDFNCGLANDSNGVEPEFAANCRLWLKDGFEDPAGDQLPCSYCDNENLILQEEASSVVENKLLDHVFVKNLETAGPIVAERVFDDPVSIEATVPPSELQPEDSPIMTHPSDHFGVELSVPLR